MANPNIVNVTTIYGNTNVSALSTTTANVLTNSAASNTVIKINNLIVANYSNANITTSVVLNRSSTVYYFAGSVVVPANSTLVVVGKDTGVYLIEGDVVQANVSANSSSTLITSYEIIS
jgi:ribosomal protein S8E